MVQLHCNQVLSQLSVLKILVDFIESGIGSHCNDSAHMGQYENIKLEKYDQGKFVQLQQAVKRSPDCENSTTEPGSGVGGPLPLSL